MYTYLNFGQAKALLAQRLVDSGKQFWSDTELGSYIVESLQSFNAHANFYRQEFVFASQANITWYDITDIAQMPTTLRALSQTDQSVLSLMEYHLLEPQTPSYPLVWAGSLQFNVSDLLNALQQARDEVLSETVCTIRQRLIPASPGRTFFPDAVLNLRRVVWIPITGMGFTPNCLMPSDAFAQQSFEPGYPQSAGGYPQTYRESTEPPLAFDVDVPPAVPGNYDILTIDAGGDLSITSPSVLPIPNDWCWVAKWGALAQLLGRDSVAADPNRAAYCTMRYKSGLAAMRSAPALISARINNVTVAITPLTEADFYSANWQAAAPGSPTALNYAGLNMVGMSPIPNSSNFSVTATVVRNMVLPVVDPDFLQVGRDDLTAVLEEAEHIAMFKVGGAEFAKTFPLHANFLRRCTLYNAKLAALSQYLELLDGMGQSDEMAHPSFQGEDATTVK